MNFKKFHPAFENVIGIEPTIELCAENSKYPFAHEAGVFVPSGNELFVTSNRYKTGDGQDKIQISKISVTNRSYSVEEIDPDIPMANGGVNYKDGVLFCCQGTHSRPSGLVYMERKVPYKTTTLLDNFYGRQFNSINDVVVHQDGSIWFTDPIYGYEQGFRPLPQLPGQVYRFDPRTKSVRVVADGFARPNGITFSPNERIVYVTDTDGIHGNGDVNLGRASTIYAFDVTYYSNQPFLCNRRVFAMADTGVPDGIKCDLEGNVYSGCGDGIHVWSPGGILLGKILIEGGVSNFCFARPGEIFALNEHRLWRVALLPSCRGSLLKL